jgi:hypothetical protein
MAARNDDGRAQLLTRTGLDWSDKYPSAIAALANLNVKTAYIEDELCGVDDAGLPSFANTQTLSAWSRRHRVEATGQPLLEREKPELAEDRESGFPQDVTAMPRRRDVVTMSATTCRICNRARPSRSDSRVARR